MYKNELTERLRIDYPIIQAPMAGGVTTSTLVAAVSNHGCLGMIGAGYLTPRQTRDQIKEVKQLTSNCFGVNLFVPQSFHATKEEVAAANALLQPIREQLHIQEEKNIEIPIYEKTVESFLNQIDVIIEEKVPVCSFTFGLPSEEVVQRLKENHIIVVGTATTVREAIEVEKRGMDLVVVQGSEAGGHRGNFLRDDEESLIGLISLIPQVVDNVRIPVVAAGGIMDGRGFLAALCLGAQGVQMGTAFLTCVESGAPDVHKDAIIHATEDEIVLTRAFSGKRARGIKNKFVAEMRGHEAAFPEFPIQNRLTEAIRKKASSQQNKEFMSLWSGQSPRLAKRQTVDSLIKHIVAEAEKIKHRLLR